MDTEKEQFHNRLAEWVARQGVLFQLRYSLAGGGANVLSHHIMVILLKFLGVCVICAIVFFIYIVKRPNSNAFKDEFKKTLMTRMECSKSSVSGFYHSQSKASIRYLNLQGGPKAFFSSFEATGISFGMGLFHGYTKFWDAEQIAIDRLSIKLKSGAETEQDAQMIGNTLLQENPNFKFENITVKNARLSWGYSERTAGSISGSNLSITKDPEGYTLNFTGGNFEQNWLQKLAIQTLTMKLRNGQVSIENAELIPEISPSELKLETNQSRVTIKQLKVTGGARPAASGTIRLKNLPFACIVSPKFDPYIDGSVSGELKVGGSTNASSGVTLEGRLSIQNNDFISITNRFPIVSTLSLISPAAQLQKIFFKEGYFQIKTNDGIVSISDIYLISPELVEIRGDFQARPPTKEEIEQMLKTKEIDAEIANDISPIALQSTSKEMLDQMKMSSQTGSDANSKSKGEQKEKKVTPFQEEIQELQNGEIKNERLAVALIYSGKISMGFPSSLFTANSAIFQKGTLSSDKTKLHLDVPIEGKIHELTIEQAEDILLLDDNLRKK